MNSLFCFLRRKTDKQGASLHAVLKSANKDADEASLVVEALALVQTGTVPDKLAATPTAAPPMSAAQREAAARPGI